MSQRNARICTKCFTRNFGDPNWNCPEHGPRQTKDQKDKPYNVSSSSNVEAEDAPGDVEMPGAH